MKVDLKYCFICFEGEFYKSRNGDTVSASSGSPYHQPVPPLSHLREMLTTSVSDLEHSNDNHDVKDLSFRTNPPQQAPVITSSAASAHFRRSPHSWWAGVFRSWHPASFHRNNPA